MRNFAWMFVLVLALAGSFALGRASSTAAAEDTSNLALRMTVLQKALALQTAVGALSMLDDGKTDAARTLIDGQLRSSLTVLRAVMPTITLSVSDAAMAKSSIADAENYIKKRGIPKRE